MSYYTISLKKAVVFFRFKAAIIMIFLKNISRFEFRGKDKGTGILAKSFLKPFPALTKISGEHTYNQMRLSEKAAIE